jgi:hypothetical protein
MVCMRLSAPTVSSHNTGASEFAAGATVRASVRSNATANLRLWHTKPPRDLQRVQLLACSGRPPNFLCVLCHRQHKILLPGLKNRPNFLKFDENRWNRARSEFQNR